MIKTGITLEIEVAYTLEDTQNHVEVELSEYLSFSGKKVTKFFEIK